MVVRKETHNEHKHIVKTELSLYFHVHKRDLLYACKDVSNICKSYPSFHPSQACWPPIWGRITVSSQFSENKRGRKRETGEASS